MKVKNVKALANGGYEIRITVNGTRISKYLSPPEKQLTQRQLEKWLETERTEFEKSVKIDIKTPRSFSEVCDMWFRDMAVHRIEDTTYDIYCGQLPRIKSVLGNIKVDKLTTYDVQVFINKLSAGDIDGTPKSQGTCNIAKSVISNVCKFARGQRMMIIDPTDDVHLPKEPRTEKEIYTRAEVAKILRYFDGYDRPQLRLFVTLGVNSGMRSGEMLGLMWKDVNFDTNTVYVHQQLRKSAKQGLHLHNETKNGKVRTIPIPQAVMDLFKDWQGKQEVNNGMVFYDIKNGGYMPGGRLRKHFEWICGKIGVRYCSPHSFRHFYASTLLADGIDVATVAYLLGDTVETVIRNYIHVESGAELKACKIIETAIATALSQTD